jgi:glutathione S-transferase
LKLSYQDIVVPDSRRMRTQVYDVSGQYYVPVLKDDDLILTETEDILNYLDTQYGTQGMGDAASTHFDSQARAIPDTLDEDDDHPSCRIN